MKWRPGKASNTDPKIALMRAATSAATTQYNSGGGLKRRGPRAKSVTLPSLDADDYSAKARRYRNKAEEARQMVDMTANVSRRESLFCIAANYEAIAEQFEMITKFRHS